MAELKIETGPLRGRTLELDPDTAFVIGRGAACTLQLESPGVADQHLVIKALKDGGFGVKKLEGRFLLNGLPADAARLREGDVLEVGDTRLCFVPPDQSAEQELGLLGGYRLLSILGKGGSGTVYRAEQMSLHREVALKVLPKETTENPEFVGRFVAEARAAARLSHPNVVDVYDVGHDDKTYYLSMELMEQGSLEDRVRRDGKMPVEECLQSMIGSAHGLAYAESMRIVHRDIKPDNLMVDVHGTTKIADLGLATSPDAEQGKIVGTPHFMSPEQAQGKTIDHRSDLYSLGCTFFRLVTGRTMFQRTTTKEILRAHVQDEPQDADEVDSDVPVEVARIIHRLVSKDLDDRYQSAVELVEDLQAVLHPPAKRGLLVATIVLVMVAAGYAIYWGVTREDKIIEVPRDDDAVRLELRETNAENELLRVLRNDGGLGPIELAEKLDQFAQKRSSTGTKAATEAVDIAVQLRADEAQRESAATARRAEVNAAVDTLRTRISELIENGEFRRAAAELSPQDIDADVLAEQPLQELLADMRDALRDAGTAKIAEYQAAVAQAAQDQDPGKMGTALEQIETALDRTAGWPAEALLDRARIDSFVADSKIQIAELAAALAMERGAASWDQFTTAVLGQEGILAKVHAFDTAGAQAAAQMVTGEVAGFEPEPLARELLSVVTAARTYLEGFETAIGGGSLTIPLTVEETLTEVTVKSFAIGQGGPVLTVLVPEDGGPREQSIAVAELSVTRLREVFPTTGPSDSEFANHLAFLGLHALHRHLTTAGEFMSKLDPQNAAENPDYPISFADVNFVLQNDTKLETPWGRYLVQELRAAQTLSHGLRAFSRGQYARAEGYLQDLQRNSATSLAVLQTR